MIMRRRPVLVSWFGWALAPMGSPASCNEYIGRPARTRSRTT